MSKIDLHMESISQIIKLHYPEYAEDRIIEAIMIYLRTFKRSQEPRQLQAMERMQEGPGKVEDPSDIADCAALIEALYGINIYESRRWHSMMGSIMDVLIKGEQFSKNANKQ